MNNNSDMPKKIDKVMESWEIKFPTNRDKSWEQLNAKIQDSKQTPIVLIRKFNWSQIGIAASICLAIGLAFLMNPSNVESFVTANTEIMEFILPDNSKVVLNSASTLTYDEDAWTDNRSVNLSGEAYFEVEKGSSFSVITNQGLVTVLGTGFNVFDRGSNFKVGCDHGKVSVKANGQEVILTEGLFAELKNGQLRNTIKEDSFKMWTAGEFNFEEENLEIVFDELERQFNVSIQYSDLGERSFTGSFNRDDLESALQVVCEPMNLTYDIAGEEVRINNKIK
ncbi:MAG: transmembrane sensor [Patiriisocius sp.]|jgi:transmembrane sensor